MSVHVSLPRRSHGTLIAAVACGLAFLLAAPSTQAADAAGPPYPRVNMAACYELDPHWPKRPADAKWGDMPGIAVSAKDEVYLFTRAKPPVQVYDRGGKFLRAWGDDVVGTAHYLKLDHQGNVWVADMGRHVVMQFTPQGKLLRTLGTPDQPGEDATHLNKPTDMTVTPEGEVFVSDGYGNNRVVHFDAGGKCVKSWGRLGTGPGEFSLPHAIAMDSKGRLYVADRNNARIQVFDRGGKFIEQWRDVLVPWGITMTASDELWVCGSSPMPWAKEGLLSCPPKDQVVMRFSASGRLLQLWTIPKGEDGREQPGDVNWLHAAAVDSHGDLYVGDIKGQRAQKFVRQK